MTATIPGPPVPFARPRFDGRSGRAYQDRDYAAWRRGAALVLRAARGPTIADGPVSVRVAAYSPRPARRPDWCDRAAWATGEATPAVTRCDLDNVAKAVLDACTDAGLWSDDRQVASIDARQWYAAVGDPPRVVVSVEAVT